ncbi:hypothetical protein LGL55_25115 [Clostridium tagluense]|uniref:IS66 family insertion sequence element accessory protein TnpA n=1 Tax=Clostridium tagluense TaxID=360422 RepID=UPI001CF2063F|nr:hypothetical protein [Clostridium tagluense]MCB2314308.1 hypothetical protein [Clostridium tagluense]MCB2319160.1 hypothetical protein [Clostridium tagluense]MCB2324054.1 hypothetical protein [Clostridium tagluense]MCB2328902.1 hypothetical protein [Clostridium tagluense]MCB2333758.1 hypothetical protein [Clostridium tagluense]
MRSTTKDQLLWEQRINERTKSGMSVSEWCKNNEISKSKYHYWNHKLTKNQKSDNEMSFAEITPILSTADEAILNSDKSNDFQIFFKSIQVTVPSNFNQTSLAGLMKVLQEL